MTRIMEAIAIPRKTSRDFKRMERRKKEEGSRKKEEGRGKND
ncbi:hypothetical protein [Microcoleus sp. bin38.metabat.b11b12b14.051]|nr:hypothetical protein [Microcoleus sp. bin38.metabat.b11b12b14.051]